MAVVLALVTLRFSAAAHAGELPTLISRFALSATLITIVLTYFLCFFSKETETEPANSIR